jgi:uncharacterized protein YegL
LQKATLLLQWRIVLYFSADRISTFPLFSELSLHKTTRIYMPTPEEVPPAIASRAVVERSSSRTWEKEARLVGIFRLLIKQNPRIFDAKTMAKLMFTCWEMYEMLRWDPFWLKFLGYKLVGRPENVSPLRLFVILQEEVKSEEWKTSRINQKPIWGGLGLTGAYDGVNEGLKIAKLTDLYVCVSNADSVAFWADRVAELLRLKSFPDESIVKEFRFALNLLFSRGGKSELEILANGMERPNQTLMCVLVAYVVRLKDHEQRFPVYKLLPSMTAVQHVSALLCGKEVSELKHAKWTTLKGSMPACFRVAVVRALAAMSTQRKMDLFNKRCEGLNKAIFRSIHFSAGLNDELKKCEKKKESCEEELQELKLLYLMQNMFYKTKYPGSQSEWEEGRWGALVMVPLAHLSRTNDLFEIPEEWVMETAEHQWQESLAGRVVPVPYRNDPQSLLARLGNSAQSIDRLLELSSKGVFTPAQALQYLRLLILLTYSPTAEKDGMSLKKLLERGVEKGQLAWNNLLKAIKFIERVFSKDEVAKILGHMKTKQDAEDAMQVDDEAEITDAAAIEGYMRVSLGIEAFKDKNGNTHEREKHRVVSTSFGQPVVDEYTSILRELLGSTFAARQTGTAPSRAAVICFTPDLLNSVRTGLPPAVPSFSRSVMWGSEHLCLQQLADADEPIKQLNVGLSYCTATGNSDPQPGSMYGMYGRTSGRLVDLAVLLFREDWGFIGECSFTRGRPGLKHSGDSYEDGVDADMGAKGAKKGKKEAVRETIEIHPEKLDVGTRYLVVCAFSNTGQDFNELVDASMYLANPYRRGNGPGGTSVLAAQTLQGSGSCNIGYCLDLREAEDGITVVDAIAIDHTLKMKAQYGMGIVAGSQAKVAEDVQRVLRTKENQGLQLCSMAAYLAAGTAGVNQVLLLHGSGEEDNAAVAAEMCEVEAEEEQEDPAVKAERERPRHVVFVLDESGSMSGEPWRQTCEAFQQYITQRLNEHKKCDFPPADVVSLVQFTHRARVVSQCVPISRAVVGNFESGGTTFVPAVQAVEDILKATHSTEAAGKEAVVIMMTDGGSHDFKEAAQILSNIKATYEAEIHVLGVGDGCSTHAVEEMGNASGTSHFCGFDGVVDLFGQLAGGSAPDVRKMADGVGPRGAQLLVREAGEAEVHFGKRVEDAILALPTCYKPDYARICRSLQNVQDVEEIVVLGGEYDAERTVAEEVRGRVSEHGWSGCLKLVNMRSTEQKIVKKKVAGAEMSVVSGWDVLDLIEKDGED